jgi:hypothetical protein
VTTYEIHIKGRLPSQLSDRLGDVTEVEAEAETVLRTGPLTQEGLHETIAHLERLGLELVGLRRVVD